MSLIEIAILGTLLINVIGFYYIFKVIMSYVRHGLTSLNSTVLKERSYYCCLFALCFFGVAVINYMIKSSYHQIFFAAIHAISFILNFNFYKKYSEYEREDERSNRGF